MWTGTKYVVIYTREYITEEPDAKNLQRARVGVMALNKFVNARPSGWTALSVASPQGCPLQKRYMLFSSVVPKTVCHIKLILF